jgi:hypothetical protein
MLLVLNRWDRARDIYQGLSSDKDIASDLRARAAIRLSCLSLARTGTLRAAELLLPILTEDDVKDEYRLAAILLAQPELLRAEDLKDKITAAGGPLLFTDAEWEMLRGIRLRLDNNATATAVLDGAAKKSSFSRSWVSTLAAQLARGGLLPRSLDEEPSPKRSAKE